MTNNEVVEYLRGIAGFLPEPSGTCYQGDSVRTAIQNLRDTARIVMLCEASVHEIYDTEGKEGLFRLRGIKRGRADLLARIFDGESHELIAAGLIDRNSIKRKISNVGEIGDLRTPRRFPRPFGQRSVE